MTLWYKTFLLQKRDLWIRNWNMAGAGNSALSLASIGGSPAKVGAGFGSL